MRFMELSDGIRFRGGQRLELDVGQLEAPVAELGEQATGVFEEAAPEFGVGGQFAEECLHVAVRHASSYCGSRSGPPKRADAR
jgi:hypothetical protein